MLVQDGKHNTKKQIDKQVNDKERVLAAMENESVRSAIEDLIKERVFYWNHHTISDSILFHN